MAHNRRIRGRYIVTKPQRREHDPRPQSESVRQWGQQLLGGQYSVREARSIDLVPCVHAFLLKGSRRILNQSDMVAELHANASGALDAGRRG